MSLRPSLPRSLSKSVHGSLNPADLPWEDYGGGTNASVLLASYLTSVGGMWWDKRSGITIATGVSAWVDRVQGASLSQATGTKQPAYNAVTGLTFDGVDDFLSGAASSLNGKPGHTVWGCGSLTLAGTGYLWSYGLNIASVYVSAGNLRAFMQAGAPFNEWSSAATSPFPRAVYAAQGQWSDGTAAQKILYKDGATAGGSRTTSGDVSAGAYGATNMFLAASGAGLSTAPVVCQHLVVVPAQVTAATIATVSQLLHSIEGF